MPVPNTFANATTSIPLSQLDANFATAITLGNTAIQLGNTVTTLNNMTLANVTVSSGNVTVTSLSGAFNGTVGATTPNTGAFTTVTATGLVKSEFSTGATAPVAKFGSTDQNRGVWIGLGADGNTLIQAYRQSDGSTTAFPLNIGASNATVASFNTTGISVTGTISGPTSISIGTNPAATGELRIPNAGSIQSRNAANSANLEIARFTAADVLQINSGGVTASVANGATVNLGVLQTGILVVVSNADFTGVFVLSNSVTYELSDPDNKYSVTAATANSINLYNSGGSVILENNSGGARSFYITNIK